MIMAQHKLPVFKGNLILRGKIEALTGLHIGGSKEKMQIGGVDLVVIRNPSNQYPYIPGSSLKGKLRHLLEYVTGGVNQPWQGKLGQVSVQRNIVRLFGIGAEVTELAHNHDALNKEIDKAKKSNSQDQLEYYQYIKDELNGIGLPRLIVRDALPDAVTTKMWDDLGSDANYTEYKAENTIDRLTSAANPRFIERVVAGSKFDFELVYTAYGTEEDITQAETDIINEDIGNLLGAMRLLESSALGKAGTRGYGRVKFHLDEPLWIMTKDYLEGTVQFEKTRRDISTTLRPLTGMDTAFYYPTENEANA